MKKSCILFIIEVWRYWLPLKWRHHHYSALILLNKCFSNICCEETIWGGSPRAELQRTNLFMQQHLNSKVEFIEAKLGWCAVFQVTTFCTKYYHSLNRLKWNLGKCSLQLHICPKKIASAYIGAPTCQLLRVLLYTYYEKQDCENTFSAASHLASFYWQTST